MRWEYRDPPLAWLMVAAYAVHLAEEWVGGFPSWFGLVAGRPMPASVFLAINGIALALMALGVRAATSRERFGWLAIAIATVLLVNALAHLLASLLTRTYSPGLISGVVLYAPIALLVLIRAWDQVPPLLLGRGLAIGILAHTAVTVTALAFT